jgi:hypothetical protein
MSEQPPSPDPYWQHDFEIDVPESQKLLTFGYRFKVHEAMERYGRSHEDLVTLSGPGTRRYFHGKPYQLEPDYHLTVALHPVPPPTGEIGVVERSSWEGLRQREIGQAQGWYYPEAATVVLWECFLEEQHRGGSPWDDTLNLLVWRTWERFLLDHSPGVARVVTTWEDSYDRETWQVFLEGQGYQQVAPASFAKEVVGQ